MAGQPAPEDRELLQQWVETWERAGYELDQIRRREIESVDTREAVQQLFGRAATILSHLPPRLTSGLVEQQAWYAKLRR